MHKKCLNFRTLLPEMLLLAMPAGCLVLGDFPLFLTRVFCYRLSEGKIHEKYPPAGTTTQT